MVSQEHPSERRHHGSPSPPWDLLDESGRYHVLIKGADGSDERFKKKRDLKSANQAVHTRMLNVAALLVGAAGILMQYFSGVGGFPTIPPGPNFLAVAAAVVALGPWRWTPVVGIIAPLFVLAGGIVALKQKL